MINHEKPRGAQGLVEYTPFLLRPSLDLDFFSRSRCSRVRVPRNFPVIFVRLVVSGDIISWTVMNSGKKKIKNKVEIADEKVVWRNFLFGLFQCYQGLEGNIDILYWRTVNNNFEVDK